MADSIGRIAAGLGVLALVLSLVQAGCAGSSRPASDPDRTRAREGSLVFSQNPGAGATQDSVAGSSISGDDGWTIVLEFFSGAGHVDRARQRRDEVVRMIGRRDVGVRVRNRGSAVVLGSYAGPDDPRAQQDLASVQAFETDGQRPYALSYLVPPPPPPPDMGSSPELNLLTAKRVAGNRALYTLQVAVFESSRRKRSKDAAERYAKQLRSQGEMAFYFHGPNRSSVTIGIFGEEAYDVQAQQVSLDVRMLQRRFPECMLDGVEVENPGLPHPSMLVQIPE